MNFEFSHRGSHGRSRAMDEFGVRMRRRVVIIQSTLPLLFLSDGTPPRFAAELRSPTAADARPAWSRPVPAGNPNACSWGFLDRRAHRRPRPTNPVAALHARTVDQATRHRIGPTRTDLSLRHRGLIGMDESFAAVRSARGAVSAFRLVRFLGPPAEPGMLKQRSFRPVPVPAPFTVTLDAQTPPHHRDLAG